MGRVVRVSERRLRGLWADLTLTQAEIAAQLGCAPKTVWTWAKRYGLPKRPAVLKSAVDVAAVRALCEAGHSPLQIARRLGLKHATVCSVIVRKRLQRNGKSVPHISLRSDDRFRAMWAAGVHLSDMAAVYGVADGTIWNVARRDGLPARVRGVGPRVTIDQFRSDQLRVAMATAARVEQAAMRRADMVDRLMSDDGLAAIVAARRARETRRAVAA